MAKAPIIITVSESEALLKRRLRSSSAAMRPRIKMLLAIATGIPSSDTLALAANANTSDQSIRTWKKTYRKGGIDALLHEGRGGSEGAIDAAGKEKIAARLADTANCFTSFSGAQAWINENLGLKMNYHGVNKYLKRHFGVSLKAGRKSHTKKSETATADYKKPSPGAETY